MNQHSGIEAVILAGGKGTRLRPHTETTPKALVTVGGRPVIEILLETLVNCNITKVTLAVNHLADEIIDALSKNKLNLKINFSKETTELSTAAPLKLIDNLPEHFLVVNGDIITDLNFKNLFETHIKSQAAMTVATIKRKQIIDYGVIESKQDNLIKSFQEKPTVDLQVSMGVYIFSKSILELIPDNEPFGFDDLMLKALADNLPLNSFPFEGYWLDIGRLEDYQKANDEYDKIKKLLNLRV